MNKNLTCAQVMALINFYIENKLNPALREYVTSHLISCTNCKKKFEQLNEVYRKYNNPQNSEMSDSLEKQPLSKDFIFNLSAYVDNELDSDDNIKIKKQTVSNPEARKELESLYKFQKLLLSAYEKTKNDYKLDNSKSIVSKLYTHNYYAITYFKKLVYLFSIIIIAIICGFIYLYF